jgi:hypothetical protein
MRQILVMKAWSISSASPVSLSTNAFAWATVEESSVTSAASVRSDEDTEMFAEPITAALSNAISLAWRPGKLKRLAPFREAVLRTLADVSPDLILPSDASTIRISPFRNFTRSSLVT